MLERILLKKLVSKGYLVIEEQSENIDVKETIEIKALLHSFSSLNYKLDEEGVRKVSNLNKKELARFYSQNYAILKDISGIDKNHQVFYANFPNMSMISDEEYAFFAAMHYITSSSEDIGYLNDTYKDFKRIELDNDKKIVLKVITVEEALKILKDIVKKLFESKIAIPYAENVFLTEMFNKHLDLIDVEYIPFKENVATFINYLNKVDGNAFSVENKNVFSFIKTPTDLLRVYAILSCDNATLKGKVRFISLKRKTRRLFLSILNDLAKNNFDNVFSYDDYAHHEFLWKRAFEKLHVGEYGDLYPHIFKIACNFRNDEYITFYGTLEANKNNSEAYLKLLKSRPGEFARRLDYMLRCGLFNTDDVLKHFSSIATKISTPVLYQLWEYYLNRNIEDTRVVKINSIYTTQYFELEDNRKEVSEDIKNSVISVIQDALREIYSNFEYKGKVYIDQDLLKSYMLPINCRNASSQNKTLTYGTRIKIDREMNKFIRFFTHFKNLPGKDYESRVDVDLSIELFDENFKEVDSLSWHNMGGGRKFDSYHSGDITSAPDGASEFVDINYEKAKKYARYILVTNSVYTEQDFAEIPECFSGVMFLPKKGRKGIIYDSKFIEHKFDLTQKGSNQNIAFAIDLKENELIWMDCPYYSFSSGVVASKSTGLSIALRKALENHINMYDFFMLHKNHLELVDSKDEADIIISDSDDATLKPYDVEKITSEWL